LALPPRRGEGWTQPATGMVELGSVAGLNRRKGHPEAAGGAGRRCAWGMATGGGNGWWRRRRGIWVGDRWGRRQWGQSRIIDNCGCLVFLRHPTRRSWSTTGRDGGVTNFASTGRSIGTSGTRYLTHRSPEGAMVIETDVNGPALSGLGNGVGCGPRALPWAIASCPFGAGDTGTGQAQSGNEVGVTDTADGASRGQL